MDKLKIEYVKKETLKPYANNAKVHTEEQIEQIKKSIEEFGFNDPIAVWKDNEIIEGHGRLLAVMDMDEITTVPIIRLDELTEEQRKAYTLVHNKLTMNTGFDFTMLDIELESIEMDMEQFGFINYDFSYLDEIDGYGEDSSLNEPDKFSVSFTFDKMHEVTLLDYIKENGKEGICDTIIKFVKGE